ncbi:MAG: hypothetical protein Q8Q59_04205 [Luteolibacter sp.]|jgi:hypothetical protein|nr:hypothetical protein [Luteolibacter sp.]
MSAFRWLASPLTGTAGVLAGLCLIAIPLRRLTSAAPVAAVQAPSAVVSAAEIPAVLRLKLLAPARHLTLKSTDGIILLDKPSLPAGESGHDVALRLIDGELDIELHADFGDHAAETAVFLTVMPDGYEEQTRYVTGGGLMDETLRYDWHPAH